MQDLLHYVQPAPSLPPTDIAALNDALCLHISDRTRKLTATASIFQQTCFTACSQQTLSRGTHDALAKLQSLSLRHSEVLFGCYRAVLNLFNCEESAIRLVAYQLITRLLQEHPRLAEDIIPAYVACFSHPDPSVVESAVANAAEFFYACPEHGTQILQLVFSAGTKGEIELKKIFGFLHPALIRHSSHLLDGSCE